jgi:hypothetical protein
MQQKKEILFQICSQEKKLKISFITQIRLAQVDQSCLPDIENVWKRLDLK